MTLDLWTLVAVLLLAMVQLSLQSVATLRQAGSEWVAGPKDQPFEVRGVGGRLVRAHRNLLEILPQFVAPLFVVHASTSNASFAVWSSWIIFVGRLLYVPAYLFGPNGLRSIFWQISQIGILVILSDLLW